MPIKELSQLAKWGRLSPDQKKKAKLALKMKDSTRQNMKQMLRIRVSLLVIVSCVGLSLLGAVPESSGGWVSCPPQVVVVRGGQWQRKGRGQEKQKSELDELRRWGWVMSRWPPLVVRSVMVGLLWWASGAEEMRWVIGLPSLVWLWQSGGWLCPRVGRQGEWQAMGWLLWQGQRLVLVAGIGFGGVGAK